MYIIIIIFIAMGLLYNIILICYKNFISFDNPNFSSVNVQLFDFRSTGDMPKCVSSHPTKSVFACGFTSGAVRVFHTPSTKVLAEHK